jgi:hypothetical protein
MQNFKGDVGKRGLSVIAVKLQKLNNYEVLKTDAVPRRWCATDTATYSLGTDGRAK